MPDGDEWDVWLILAGRGTGKTRAGAEAVLDHLERYGSSARVGVGAPTAADVRDVCAEGVSGLITIARDHFASYNRSLGEAHHRRGGYVKFLGAEEPARWNGPQWSLLWADELALWNQDSWEMAQFGLRLGDHPRAIATTTPKARVFVQELAQQPSTHVTRAKTSENPYLSELVRNRLYDRYAGTRLGRQELEAEWLDDVPGALWQHAQLDKFRIKQTPELQRVVVAIDPAVTSGEDSDETGIVVCGRGVDGRGYVLADRTCRLSPDGWVRRAVTAYEQFAADRVIAEVNNGGDLVERVLRTLSRGIPYRAVRASRGKITRAEPIAALYEQGKISHIGSFPELEDQMCQYTPDGYDGSPDRVDALVWAFSELMLGSPEVRFI